MSVKSTLVVTARLGLGSSRRLDSYHPDRWDGEGRLSDVARIDNRGRFGRCDRGAQA